MPVYRRRKQFVRQNGRVCVLKGKKNSYRLCGDVPKLLRNELGVSVDLLDETGAEVEADGWGSQKADPTATLTIYNRPQSENPKGPYA
jgi:hypothetical protein